MKFNCADCKNEFTIPYRVKMKGGARTAGIAPDNTKQSKRCQACALLRAAELDRKEHADPKKAFEQRRKARNRYLK